VQRFRGGLAFKAHRLLYHSTLGLRVIEKKKRVGSFGGGRARDAKPWPRREVNLVTKINLVAKVKLVAQQPSKLVVWGLG